MSDLEKYRYDFEIIRLTADQIMKDFAMHGITISFSGNELTAWNELVQQISPVLLEMYQKNKSAFQSLLYRIDISEKDMRFLYDAATDDFAGKLAETVIRREFKKVLLRKFYSKKPPES